MADTETLIVSLEAIFLSTFVMIGQNRQAAFQQSKSDKDYQDVNTLVVENTNLTRSIHELTEELHRRVLGDAPPRYLTRRSAQEQRFAGRPEGYAIGSRTRGTAEQPTAGSGGPIGKACFVVTIVLPDTTQSPGLARRSVVQFSDEERLSGGSTLALIVSELVTNAIEHGAAPIELRLEHREGVVTIEVSDGRAGPQPQMRAADRVAPSGRGLRIVAALAREWGVRTTATGKVVWARVTVGAPRPQLA